MLQSHGESPAAAASASKCDMSSPTNYLTCQQQSPLTAYLLVGLEQLQRPACAKTLA